MYLLVNGTPLTTTAVVQSNGTFSLGALLTLNPGDSVVARTGSVAGPASNTVLATAPSSMAVPTATPVPVDGGATLLTTNGPPGAIVSVVDLSAGGMVLGSQTAPSSGPVALTLNSAAPSGHLLAFVANGVELATLPVGPAGSPPVLVVGSILAQGGSVTARGVPGSVIQLVDAQGRVLGAGTVGPQGEASFPVSGAEAGVSVSLVQNGVVAKLDQPVLDLGGHTAFLSTNIFNPMKGVSLGIGFMPRASGRVTVKVFNLNGELVYEVADTEVQAGVLCSESWDGRNASGQWVASGIYVVSIYGSNIRELKKVVVLK